MRALTEEEIRASFVNADPDEAAAVSMPHDLLLTEWDYLGFLAWRDPVLGKQGYVVVERDGRPVGIVLRASDPGRTRSGMCNICHTMQPGNQVALFAARRAGEAGRRGGRAWARTCAPTCPAMRACGWSRRSRPARSAPNGMPIVAWTARTDG